jgi:regulator of nucleoside diphosphate kinase
MSPQHNKIVITEFDLRRLTGLVEMLRARSAVDNADLAILEDELERAEVVSPQDVPEDVVTMNSCVKLRDLDTGEELSLTLVFPGTADAKKHRISVLAPIGVALLGCRAQEEVSWPTPSRVRRLRIERILYQPEAAGDYEL